MEKIMLTSYPRTLNVIRREKKILGFSHCDKSYVIGFPKISHASYMACHLTKDNVNKLLLLKHHVMDVTEEINVALRARDMSLASVDGNVTIDMYSSLILPKTEGTRLQDIEIEEYCFEEFLLFPFTRSLGIALPMVITEDTSKRLVFESQVIDPCEEPRMFRNFVL